MSAGRVAVAMSGGVDSSCAAAVLKAEGYDLIGFSMQLWDQRRSPAAPDEHRPGRCCSIDDIHDARAVAARLDIPHYVLNLQEDFEQEVVRTFIADYTQGRTPSPCILCNSRMKFDRLLRAAVQVRATHVATGHYARVEFDARSGRHVLYKGRDPDKDQSYYLFELRQEQLARAMFPLGGLGKAEVRRIARAHGLEVADKEDSQEICFVPDGDYAAFVERHFAEAWPEAETPAGFAAGDIVDDTGRVIGRHAGIHHFTVGQRRGLGVAHVEPLYVIAIEPEENRIVVGGRPGLMRAGCRVFRPNWISVAEPCGPMRAAVKIRSRHPEAMATITLSEGDTVDVAFDTPQPAVAPGQAAVFYDGDRVVGGGWIARD